jgi:hypothetical protein
MWRKSSAGRMVEVMAVVRLGDVVFEREGDFLSSKILANRLDTVRHLHFTSRRKGARVSSSIVLQAALMMKQALANHRSDHLERPFCSRCNDYRMEAINAS